MFAVGRFLCALIEVFFKPTYILLFLFVGMIVTSALAMSLNGSAGVAMIILCQFFEVCAFFLLLKSRRSLKINDNTKSSRVSSRFFSPSLYVALVHIPN